MQRVVELRSPTQNRGVRGLRGLRGVMGGDAVSPCSVRYSTISMYPYIFAYNNPVVKSSTLNLLPHRSIRYLTIARCPPSQALPIPDLKWSHLDPVSTSRTQWIPFGKHFPILDLDRHRVQSNNE